MSPRERADVLDLVGRRGDAWDDEACATYFERTGLPRDAELATRLEAQAGPRPGDDLTASSDER